MLKFFTKIAEASQNVINVVKFLRALAAAGEAFTNEMARGFLDNKQTNEHINTDT